MATKQKDLTGLKHSLVNGPLHFYSEVQADGTEVLRHIRAQQHIYKTPTDITVDGLPSGSVGTEQIEDQSVRLEDLSQEVRDAMAPAVATESAVRQIVTGYSSTQNT